MMGYASSVRHKRRLQPPFCQLYIVQRPPKHHSMFGFTVCWIDNGSIIEELRSTTSEGSQGNVKKTNLNRALWVWWKLPICPQDNDERLNYCWLIVKCTIPPLEKGNKTNETRRMIECGQYMLMDLLMKLEWCWSRYHNDMLFNHPGQLNMDSKVLLAISLMK